MRSLATFVSLLTLGCFISLAQTAQQQKAQDKDADKKQAVASSRCGKKDKARNEKKEEPKKEKEDEKKPGMNADTFSGLKFRLIGPAVASGRVMSIAVNPKNKFEYYVGVASGGRLEDGQRRHDVDSAFRRRRLVFDRLGRTRSKRSFCRVGGIGREQFSAQRRLWRWHLSVR